jgi:6-phosphogluconolactonase
MDVYAGTYTRREPHVNGKGRGIYHLALDGSTGRAEVLSVTTGPVNPSYLTFDSRGDHLYAVNELGVDLGPHGTVTAFAVDRASGSLQLLGRRPSGGLGPCYVSVDAEDRYVLVANYVSGEFSVHRVLGDGDLSGPIQILRHSGSGPHEHQDGPHAHCVRCDPRNRFVLALDKGIDRVLVYRLDAASGMTCDGEPYAFQTDAGDGPRHVAFHPSGRFVYVINELTSSVLACAYDPETGRILRLQKISTIPDGYEGENSGADIHVHPSGTLLFASNRGHDSIAIFRIRASGELEVAGYAPSGGRTPRGFVIDPAGDFLLVANQDSDNVVVFSIERATGELRPANDPVEVPTPVCLKFRP